MHFSKSNFSWVVPLTVTLVPGGLGMKDRRPALDSLLDACRRRQVDVVAITKLDRLARSVHHLVALGRELEALGVDLVVLDQTIDTTTPAGRLLFHVLASIAEFERDLIRDRVIAGVRRARAQGRRLGPAPPTARRRRPRTRAPGARPLASRRGSHARRPPHGGQPGACGHLSGLALRGDLSFGSLACEIGAGHQGA